MGRKTCKGCDQFDHHWKDDCNYSCNKQIEYENEFEIQKFVKELYKASGVYVSPSSVYKYKNIIEEFL